MSDLDFEEYDNIHRRCKEIAVSKNTDYGSEVLLRFAEQGVVVRMSDKMDRLVNLVWKNQKGMVNDEKVEDTAMDMINYATYLIMMKRKNLIQKNGKPD